MKNQYFGDEDDYMKYGLIRSILRSGTFRLLIAWMLTPNDGGSHGQKTAYLNQSEKWANHDPELYQGLQTLMGDMFRKSLSLMENTTLLDEATYFSSLVPDEGEGRAGWAAKLLQAAQDSDLVFLDPDIGIETPSVRYGNKNSSRYIYWSEVSTLWNAGKSILIYQHFPRENQTVFVQRRLGDLKHHTNGCEVNAFSTSSVAFLLALQPDHSHWQPEIVRDVEEHWGDRMHHWELYNPNEGV